MNQSPPTTKNYLTQNVTSAEVEKPCCLIWVRVKTSLILPKCHSWNLPLQIYGKYIMNSQFSAVILLNLLAALDIVNHSILLKLFFLYLASKTPDCWFSSLLVFAGSFSSSHPLILAYLKAPPSDLFPLALHSLPIHGWHPIHPVS